jgi:hypothetical protein
VSWVGVCVFVVAIGGHLARGELEVPRQEQWITLVVIVVFAIIGMFATTALARRAQGTGTQRLLALVPLFGAVALTGAAAGIAANLSDSRLRPVAVVLASPRELVCGLYVGTRAIGPCGRPGPTTSATNDRRERPRAAARPRRAARRRLVADVCGRWRGAHARAGRRAPGTGPVHRLRAARDHGHPVRRA